MSLNVNGTVNVLLKSKDRDDREVTVAESVRSGFPNLDGVYDAMIRYQRYTASDDIVAVIADTGERLARLRFEWLED